MTLADPKDPKVQRIILDRDADLLALNPRMRKRRELIVEYAEARGGTVLDYFQRFYPEYWKRSPDCPRGEAGPSLGLSRDEENQMVVEMYQMVMPKFQNSSEYDLPRDLIIPDNKQS